MTGFNVLPLLLLVRLALRALKSRSRAPAIEPVPPLLAPELVVIAAPPPPAPEPLCYSCTFAQVARGFGVGEEMVLCVLGGIVRGLPFAVRECTTFRARAASERSAGIGFGSGSAPAAADARQLNDGQRIPSGQPAGRDLRWGAASFYLSLR